MVGQATRVQNQKLLPSSLERALKRGASSLLGASFITTALLGWVSLLSWSVTDPSYNRTTYQPPVNYLGETGAAFADMLFQFVGLTSIFALLPLAFWGIGLWQGKIVSHMRWRLMAWPLALMLIAGLFSFLPKAASWPLPTGYGGIIGDMTYHFLSDASRKINPIYGHLAIAILLFSFAVTLLFFTLGVKRQDMTKLFMFEDGSVPNTMISGSLSKVGYWMRRARYTPRNSPANQRRWWRNAALNDAPSEHQHIEQPAYYQQSNHKQPHRSYGEKSQAKPSDESPDYNPQSYSTFGLMPFLQKNNTAGQISQEEDPNTPNPVCNNIFRPDHTPADPCNCAIISPRDHTVISPRDHTAISPRDHTVNSPRDHTVNSPRTNQV